VRERTKQLAEKHQQLRTAYVQTLSALAEAVDAKDPYTRGHSERVGVYASKIARELGFSRDYIERVYIAGLLHDVGKIGVADHVISKPSRLTPEEYAEMMKHPDTGSKILEPVDFLADIAPSVRHHHEWFDGDERGHPDQLCGETIPLPARIILVADTVERATDPIARRSRSTSSAPSSASTRGASSTRPASRPACTCSTARARTSSGRIRSSTSTSSSGASA
jgi:putative nucleotidyltransferase with HDIG domain